MKLALLLLTAAVPALAAKNVVLVTIDGVRREEFFSNAPDPSLSSDTAALFPKLWARESQGVVLGDPARGGSMKISNLSSLSLPGYQSIMAGHMTRCLNNDCARIKAETVVERLAKDLGFAPSEQVVVAGWSGVSRAVERTAGATATFDGPAQGSRPDADTWAAAKKALDARPRFLWLAFNDPDDHAHKSDYAGYLSAIRLCDGWLEELFAWLDAAGEYGKETAVIVTTDHGRGLGRDYPHHGARAAAHHVWLYARGAGISTAGRTGGDGRHAQIRATIEALYGLNPSGKTLPGVLP